MTKTLVEKLRTAATSNGPMLKSLRDLLDEAADELETTDKFFDLRWNADMRAIRRWRAAKPGRDLIMPDHADLCTWLLEEHEKIVGELTEAKRVLGEQWRREPRDGASR